MSDQPGADRFTYEGGPASDPPPGRVSDEQVEIDLEQMLASVMADREAEADHE